jgi:hypothetical protein
LFDLACDFVVIFKSDRFEVVPAIVGLFDCLILFQISQGVKNLSVPPYAVPAPSRAQ